ncbi:TNT domain-containing protein [Aldersonia kunmingensis]|uniref:TNT domain-containing protein n=1 Tax=Aldersonia kunmingensis TaxID=408066 RepID=UPI00082A8F9F|nr:TNT domain-containing protein [Aldersonia kunmingensis]
MNRRSALLVFAFVLTLFSSGAAATAAPSSPFGSVDFGSLGIPRVHGCSAELHRPGDWRLGPKELSNVPPVGPQLAGYERTGGLNDEFFLGRWWDEKADPRPTWRYPEQGGYVIVDGKPLRAETTLEIGTLIDRYGGASGNYFAPAGTSYGARALPPGNLTTDDKPENCNYHVYLVIKPLPVYTGPIADAFEQPGGGTQYEVTRETVKEEVRECGSTIDVTWLRCAHYLALVFS